MKFLRKLLVTLTPNRFTPIITARKKDCERNKSMTTKSDRNIKIWADGRKKKKKNCFTHPADKLKKTIRK